MMRHIALLALLCVAGCQTAKMNTNVTQEPKPKTITLTVNRDGNGYDLQLDVNTVDGKMCCPRISVLENEWGLSESGNDFNGFSYVTHALIGEEMVEISCEPGMRATMKVIPLESEKVQVKGMYVYNRVNDKQLTTPTTVVPFNVVVKIEEPTVIYNMQMEFEPSL